jgi:hypothetical protein
MSNKTQTIIAEEEVIKDQTINDEVVATEQGQTTPVVEKKQSKIKTLWNKGLEFAGKHKFGIGVALGVGSVIAADYAISKVEEKYSPTNDDIVDAEFTEVEPEIMDDIDVDETQTDEEVIVDESDDTDE